MDGPDHYREAERLLGEAESLEESSVKAVWCLELAKLHTALAQVAATGLDDHARDQAHRYADLGYVAFACDMYGRGVAGDRERVMATLMGLRDAPDRLARRAAAGLVALSGCAEVNGHLAAVGFCFGGMAALTLARSGAALDAVVSMHGSLATTKPAEPGAVMAKVLVCHGRSIRTSP